MLLARPTRMIATSADDAENRTIRRVFRDGTPFATTTQTYMPIRVLIPEIAFTHMCRPAPKRPRTARNRTRLRHIRRTRHNHCAIEQWQFTGSHLFIIPPIHPRTIAEGRDGDSITPRRSRVTSASARGQVRMHSKGFKCGGQDMARTSRVDLLLDRPLEP